jgi:NADPH-dependent ferric siderophore reductase
LVQRTEHLSPWLVRVTLAGPELEGFTVDQPAASVVATGTDRRVCA